MISAALKDQADKHKQTVYVRIVVAGWNVTIIQGDDDSGLPFSAKVGKAEVISRVHKFSSPYGWE